MSQLHVEKRRAEAELTLATGETLRGCFFLADANATHVGPERVADLLNAGAGFFPFDRSGPPAEGTVMVNRAHLIYVKLPVLSTEARLDAGYDVAVQQLVTMLLSNGIRLTGVVRIYGPEGRDRLSDYARSLAGFSYLESADGTFIVNSVHVVELREREHRDAGTER